MITISLDCIVPELEKSLAPGYVAMMYECYLVTINDFTVVSPKSISAYKGAKNLLEKQVSIEWKRIVDLRMIKTHTNQNQTTDFGTMILSLALVLKNENVKKQCKVKEFSIEGSVLGTGIDFWIGDNANLKVVGSIEISGIKKLRPNNSIKTRLKKKIERMKNRAPLKVPSFVTLIEFSKFECLITNLN